MEHLDALLASLSREIGRSEEATTSKERKWRDHNVKMIQKEIEGEYKFLGIDTNMTDDELLGALGA